MARGLVVAPDRPAPKAARSSDVGDTDEAEHAMLLMAWTDAQHSVYPKVQLVTNKLCRELLERQWDVVSEVVESKANIDLGWLALRMVSSEVMRPRFSHSALAPAVGSILRVSKWYRKLRYMRAMRAGAADGGVELAIHDALDDDSGASESKA